MADAEANMKDRLLNELSSSLGPATDGIASETPAPPPPVIPDHELIRRIGKGSYGEVWLARNALGTWRAVKIVHRRAFDSDRPYEREFAGIRRFEPVSRTHPSQLNVLHVGRNDSAGHFYYVMELADAAPAASVQSSVKQYSVTTEGAFAPNPLNTDPLNTDYSPRTLRSDLFHRGRLPCDECLHIGLALATALDHLHRHGLVHRDIKPSNIVFLNGIPKLADIGLVTHVEATLSFVGTEGYLPPEGPGTPQADIYSLGKVLYEMATGRDRQDYPELPTNLIAAPAAERAALAELNEVIVRACHADAKERYQTAAELHADLALLQSGKSVSRMRSVERRLKLVARASAIVTAVAIVAAGLYFWQSRQTHVMRELAATNASLADQARKSERAARENLYAADLNLAHQALLANNSKQVRMLLQNHVPKPGEPDLRGFEWRYLWEQSRSEELFSLRGQTERTRVVSFLPDGRRLATGGEDGIVKIWELDLRREIASLSVTGVVRSVSFCSTGDQLAIITADSLSLWDARTWSPVRQLPDAGWFSPDGKYLLTASRSPRPASGILITSKLILLDAASGSVVRTLELPEAWRHPRMGEAGSWAVFSPDGHRVGIFCADAIRLFSIPDFREVGVFERKLSVGASSNPFIRFSPDNRTLATLDSTDFGVQFWDTASHRKTRVLPAHSGALQGASFSPDGSRLATCGADQTIKLWAVETGELVRSFRGQADQVVFSPDGKLLASIASDDGVVKLWDANAKPQREFFRDPLGPVGFNLDGGLVAFGENLKPVAVDPATLHVTNSGLLNVANSRAIVQRLDVITSKPGSSKERWYDPYLGNLSPDGTIVGLFELWEQAMDFWDLRDGKLLCSVEATKPWVAFAPKRQLVATDTTNATTTVWQLPSGTLKWVFTNRVGLFQAIAFSPDENFIVTDEGAHLKLWRIEGEAVTPTLTFNSKRNPVIGLTFSPDGSLLATGEEGGPIKLWAMPSARQVGVLSGHTYSVISLAFNPDGRTLASMCDDRTLRLWHVATRREMLRFETSKQDHGFFSLTFSPDGRALAARRVDDEGAITWVWHAPSLAEIAVREANH